MEWFDSGPAVPRILDTLYTSPILMLFSQLCIGMSLLKCPAIILIAHNLYLLTLIPIMNFLMGNKIGALVEAFPTVRTLIAFLSGVDSLMSSQG